MTEPRFVRVWASLAAVGVAAVAMGTRECRSDEPRPMSFVDLLEVPGLRSPRLSPDGRELLYVLGQADWKQNRDVRHIWRQPLAGGAPLQLTNGSQGEESPQWSPDGKTIAYLAKRGDDKQAQIYVIHNRGGEGRKVTSRQQGVKQFAWSADGKSLWFLSPEDKDRQRLEREKLQDDVFAFGENFQHVHLWKIGLPEGREQRITGGDYSLLDFHVANDGSQIVVQRSISPLFGDSDRGEVCVMQADGQGLVALTDNGVPESSARISPDNQRVLFVAKANQKFEYYYNGNLFVVPAAGGPVRELVPELPYEIFEARWSRDGRSIFFRANMGLHVELFEVRLDSGDCRQLTSGNHAIRAWHYRPSCDRHVMSLDRTQDAGDVWILDAAADPDRDAPQPRRITHVFANLSQRFLLPQTERIEFKGADGVSVEGLLSYPLDYVKGRRYPLVVQAHGGPAHSDRFGFGAWRDYIPVLAAHGYAVLKPNYRGSTGYGDEFLRDMVGHYYQNAHLDVLAAVDHLLKAGIVDGERMAMMGWSGGGHMTNKIITFTDRFRAASSGAGAVNWISMYGQSDVRIYRTPWFGGTPWQKDAPIDVYWEHSPLKDIARVRTPTLILVGEKDVRVPMAQSVELYRALKANGVDTHLYVAPRAPHGWTELRHRLFKMNVEFAWFEQHVRQRDFKWQSAPPRTDADDP